MKSKGSWLQPILRITCAVAAISAQAALAEGSAKHKAPPDEWKGTNWAAANSASISSKGEPFDPPIHAKITPQGEICADQLNAAIYRQDVLHAFESKAHFDNCDFDSSVSYIHALIAEAERAVAKAPASPEDKDVPKEVEQAMLNLGQALHAIQDFYAHSNYVELMQARHPEFNSASKLPVVEVWKSDGLAKLMKLKSEGLYSGQVSWSFPYKCDKEVPTHAALAKDSPTTSAGKAASTFKDQLTGKPINNHLIAYRLALRASQDFLRWAGKTNPKLEIYCGSTLKYIVQTDRRSDGEVGKSPP